MFAVNDYVFASCMHLSLYTFMIISYHPEKHKQIYLTPVVLNAVNKCAATRSILRLDNITRYYSIYGFSDLVPGELVLN